MNSLQKSYYSIYLLKYQTVFRTLKNKKDNLKEIHGIYSLYIQIRIVSFFWLFKSRLVKCWHFLLYLASTKAINVKLGRMVPYNYKLSFT